MSARAALCLGLLSLAGCSGELLGLEDNPTPLARIRVRVEGELEPLRPPESLGETPRLRVALVWGQQWLAEPFCFLPARTPEARAVVAAGCRDPYGFAPLRVAGSVAVVPGDEATIELIDLPAADDMVGDLTGRIAYGSLVVFDDRDGNGTLDLREFESHLEPEEHGPGSGNGPPPPEGEEQEPDHVYGASFVSMTRPDLRISFLEGAFDPYSAFYPRTGCPAPPKGFAVLGAGGFTTGAVLEALLQGRLPQQDPASCTVARLDDVAIPVRLVPIDTVRDVACSLSSSRRAGGGGDRLLGFTSYQELPVEPPELDRLIWACVPTPTLGGLGGGQGGAGGGGGGGAGGGGGPGPGSSGPEQLVIALPSSESKPGDPAPVPLGPADCKGLVHHVLRGCENDAGCETPSWDRTASPPEWWPCSLGDGSP